MRDHYVNFTKNILTDNVAGENEAAQDILSEEEYLKKMDDYDKELSALTQPIWEKSISTPLKRRQSASVWPRKPSPDFVQ